MAVEPQIDAALLSSIGLSMEEFHQLTPDQQHLILAQRAFAIKHAGHEEQHQEMLIILLFTLIISQIILSFWKKYRKSSYDWASLIGLWTVPFLMGINAGNYRFVCVWTLYSVFNIFIVKSCFDKPLLQSTPGRVYKWFAFVYTLSYILGLCGYWIALLSFFRVPESLNLISEKSDIQLFQLGLLCIFYGLYFGTLGRDCIERLSDVMADSLGYYNRKGIPVKQLKDSICAICGGSTDKKTTSNDSSSSNFSISTFIDYLIRHWKLSTPKEGVGAGKDSITLKCNHTYHESCIRGWTLVGKKDSCPYCKEKVDLKDFGKGSNPWDKGQEMFMGICDALRYLVVWNPVIFMVVHYVFKFMGLD